MSLANRGDVAAGTSIASAIASFLEPITGILQFLVLLIGFIAGCYAIAVHRKNLRKR